MDDRTRGSVYRDLIRSVELARVVQPVAETRKAAYLQSIARGVTRLETPSMITWNVTNSCTLSCTYCAVDAPCGPADRDSRTRDVVLERILGLNPVFVSLLGGEPTLVPEIEHIVRRLISSGIHADITTNGARVSERFASAMASVDTSLLSIMLSIDSSDQKTNDAARGRGAFLTATRAAARLSTAKVPFAIGMTVTPRNMHHLRSTYELACSLGAKYFCSWFVIPAGRATISDVALPDEEFVRQAYDVLHCSETHETKVARLDLSVAVTKWLREARSEQNVDPMMSEVASMVGCEGCRYRALIDANGDVYPCDFLQAKDFRMGNVLSDDWNSIWHSRPARFKSLLTRSTKPGCSSCPMLECDTGCFGVSYAHFTRSGKLLPMCEVC